MSDETVRSMEPVAQTQFCVIARSEATKQSPATYRFYEIATSPFGLLAMTKGVCATGSMVEKICVSVEPEQDLEVYRSLLAAHRMRPESGADKIARVEKAIAALRGSHK